MFWSRRKSALLLDFENLYRGCGQRRFVDRIDNWLLWLEHGKFDPDGVRREFVSRQVFWVPSYEQHRLEFTRRRFEVHMCRAIRKEKSSSADFDLTIRAAELRHERRDLEEVIILSMDSDFVSVLTHVQLHDLHGVGMVDPEAKFAASYRNIVDLTIEKPDFMAAYDYVPVKRGWFGPRLVRAPEPAPQQQPRAPESTRPPSDRAPANPKRAAAPPQTFDPAAAARIICAHAEETGLVYLGRELVRKLLRNQPGFIVNSRPWSDGPYRVALDRIGACDSRLSVEKVGDRGIVLTYRSASGSAAAAA
ncbi:MAG: NYN domain-containing protein [Phycisphaerales bacterium]|nr:NYN domain-containing protein [Hyphomonadaceae bacterium]